MPSVVELAEAHLLNVQREIQTLNQRKVEINAEIERLTQFLNEAVGTVEEYKTTNP